MHSDSTVKLKKRAHFLSLRHAFHLQFQGIHIINSGGGLLWSLPAGGAPPGAAQICRSPENEMIVLLQREKKTRVTETH